MSAFAPADFAEAKATHKPMSRKTALRSVGMSRQRDSLLPGAKSALAHNSTLRRRNSAPQPKAKRAKKVPDGKLKKKVWVEFSMFIRTRGASEDGRQQCFTCDVEKFWRELEAGHFIPGRHNANLFDERAVRPQCRKCNGHLRGNTIVYYPKMVSMYGQEAVDEMIRNDARTHKWQGGELQSLLEHYTALNDANPLIERKTKRSKRAA